MWFKTRSGLVSITEPTEILVARYDWGDGERWGVYAYQRTQATTEFKGWFGRSKSKSPPYLAFFLGGSDTQHQLGQCLARIEQAIRAQEPLCDLSDVGAAEAWKSTWNLIHWPKTP